MSQTTISGPGTGSFQTDVLIVGAGPTGLTLGAALAAGASAFAHEPGRELRVIYVGDGMASVGARRPAALGAEAEELAHTTGARVTTVRA